MRMKSDVVKRGVERAPHRSLLRALGLTDWEIDQPFIGAINSYNEAIPGHVGLRQIAEAVKAGIRTAGGTPFECSTIGDGDVGDPAAGDRPADTGEVLVPMRA